MNWWDLLVIEEELRDIEKARWRVLQLFAIIYDEWARKRSETRERPFNYKFLRETSQEENFFHFVGLAIWISLRLISKWPLNLFRPRCGLRCDARYRLGDDREFRGVVERKVLCRDHLLQFLAACSPIKEFSHFHEMKSFLVSWNFKIERRKVVNAFGSPLIDG